MDSALASSSSSLFRPPHAPLLSPKPHSLKNSSQSTPTPPTTTPRLRVSSSTHKNPILRTVDSAARTVILTAAAALLVGKFPHASARAAQPPPPTADQTPITKDQSSPLSSFLESSAEAVDALKGLLQQKLENGEDGEALKILKKLVAAQPGVSDWKFLTARLLNEMGRTEEARQVFEELLEADPLSYEALFENALLMDKCGEGEAAISRLEEALRVAESENKVKEARDVRLIMAQVEFLHKNVEEALRRYDELAKEDPNDYRPYFCKGMIYSLMDRNAEAKVEFAKYKERSPKKFEVEGFLRTPLSRMKLFGTEDSKN